MTNLIGSSVARAFDQPPRTLHELVGSIAGLATLLKEQRWLFLGSTALILILQLTTGGAAVLTAAITARIAKEQLAGIWLWIALLAVAVVLVGLVTWLESWFAHVLAYRVLASMRITLHAAIARIAPGGLANRRTGEVAGAAVNDAEQLEWFYAHTAGATICSLVTPLIWCSLAYLLIGPAALIILLAVVGLLVPLLVLAPVQARQGEVVRHELSTLKSDTLEGAQGLRDLLTLGALDSYRTRVQTATVRLQGALRRFSLRAGGETAVADAVLAIVNISLIAVLAAAVRSGSLDATVLPVAVTLLFSAFAPVLGVYAMWQRLGEMAAAALRVRAVSLAPPVVSNTSASDESFDATGDIILDQVSAAYGARVALRAASVRFPAGQTTAIVGPSGAGKSTLVHLLVRFADPTVGTVRIGGRDLTTVRDDQVREQIVLVPQTSYALRATLAENLRLADPTATDEQLLDVLGDAALGETVAALADGLETRIGEGGATLSGGQLQRLAIARALLLDPPVLILDEPIANLDALAEAELTSSLRRARAGRTTIMIAHRVSTIRAADQVVFVSDGEILAVGTHQELLANHSGYRLLLADGLANA